MESIKHFESLRSCEQADLKEGKTLLEVQMNWARIEGNWGQVSSELKCFDWVCRQNGLETCLASKPYWDGGKCYVDDVVDPNYLEKHNIQARATNHATN